MPRNNAKDAKAFRALRGFSRSSWSKRPAPILLILCLLCLGAMAAAACSWATPSATDIPATHSILNTNLSSVGQDIAAFDRNNHGKPYPFTYSDCSRYPDGDKPANVERIRSEYERA
jgi:hypothetical protein